jgi:hypothetical protein
MIQRSYMCRPVPSVLTALFIAIFLGIPLSVSSSFRRGVYDIPDIGVIGTLINSVVAMLVFLPLGIIVTR